MDNKLRITPKPPKGEDGYKTFSIRIRDELDAELERMASLTGRSRNELVGLLLDYAIHNCEITSS